MHEQLISDDDIPSLTEQEVAKLLGTSAFTLARERKRGRIAYHRPGGHVVRYSMADIRAYIARTRRPAKDEHKGRAA